MEEEKLETFTRTNFLREDVPTQVVQILEFHPQRLSWSLINLGTAPIFIAFDDRPSTTRGIRVGGNGGAFSTTFRDDPGLPQLPAFAIADGATSKVFIVEVIRR